MRYSRILKPVIRFLHPLRRAYWVLFQPQTYGIKVVIPHPADPHAILVTRTSYGDRTVWHFPGGGYNPKKETKTEAARREILEELNIRLSSVEPLGVYYTKAEGKRDTVYILLGTIPQKHTLAPSVEIEDISWKSINDLRQSEHISQVTKHALTLFGSHNSKV